MSGQMQGPKVRWRVSFQNLTFGSDLEIDSQRYRLFKILDQVER